MTSRANYFRLALSRAESNKILLAKVSVIPCSNDSKRSKMLHAAKVLQCRTQMNLGELVNAKQDEWLAHMSALDRDFKKFENTLEKLWTKPLNSHSENSSHTSRRSGN